MKPRVNLNDPDTWRNLERQAYDGTVDTKPLPPAAYKYFTELTALYYAYRTGAIPRDEAERCKRTLHMEYDRNVAKEKDIAQIYCRYQDAIRTAGTLTREIEKSVSVFEIAGDILSDLKRSELPPAKIAGSQFSFE